MVSDRKATLRQLMASSHLHGATVIGGEQALDAAVADIVLRGTIDARTDLTPGEVLVLDGVAMAGHTYRIDVAIRSLSDAAGAGLVIVNPPIGSELSSRRLANRMGVAVVGIDHVDPVSLVHDLRSEIWQPELVNAGVMNEALRVFGDRKLATPAEVVDFIASLTSTRCALVSSDREHVAGDEIRIDGRRLAQKTAHMVDRSSSVALHSVPIALAPGEPASFWLISETSSSEALQRSLKSVLSLASWYLASVLAAARVHSERDARRRIAVLNEILDTSEPAEGELRSQMISLGWSAAGWNTGIHIKLRGHSDSSRVIQLHRELVDHLKDVGIVGPLVERNDGWSGWVTTKEEPSATSFPEMVRSIDTALTRFASTHVGLTTHAGIGRPRHELAGLRRSLGEANEASVIAHARNRDRSGVEHIDQIGVQRILMGWFSSDDFAQYAASVLQPLSEYDAESDLVTTLEAYLDSNCSTSEAAVQLGVHRNTVANRVRRITEVLGVGLDDPETRLSLQLACRMTRLSS